MGASTGTGGAKKALVKTLACGLAMGMSVAALAACSTSNGSKVPANVTLQKALDDYRAGNTTLAKAEFEQVVKTDPTNKYGWYNLGVLAQDAGDKSTAATDYQKSLKLDSKFESALYNYGVLQYSLNKLDDAVSLLTRAVAQNGKDANAHWNLGLSLAARAHKGDDKESTKELNAGLKLDPTLTKTLTTAPQVVPSTTTSTP